MPFVDGSEVSIPSLRRRMMCGAEAGVEKKPVLLEVSKKREIWVSGVGCQFIILDR